MPAASSPPTPISSSTSSSWASASPELPIPSLRAPLPAARPGVSFSIRRGSCFGLLGPNGAGKSTALEVIEGIIPPTAGEVLYKGRPPTDAFREEVGIQFQHTSLLEFRHRGQVWERTPRLWASCRARGSKRP
ncbi:MAG: ATP-binding cassette domain-containing protein [Thermodesulfobacteriota bacterium]